MGKPRTWGVTKLGNHLRPADPPSTLRYGRKLISTLCLTRDGTKRIWYPRNVLNYVKFICFSMQIWKMSSVIFSCPSTSNDTRTLPILTDKPWSNWTSSHHTTCVDPKHHISPPFHPPQLAGWQDPLLRVKLAFFVWPSGNSMANHHVDPVLMGKSSINGPFYIAILTYQRVYMVLTHQIPNTGRISKCIATIRQNCGTIPTRCDHGLHEFIHLLGKRSIWSTKKYPVNIF